MDLMRQTLDAGLPALGLDLPEEARNTLCAFGAAVVKQNEEPSSSHTITNLGIMFVAEI